MTYKKNKMSFIPYSTIERTYQRFRQKCQFHALSEMGLRQGGAILAISSGLFENISLQVDGYLNKELEP